MSKTERFVTLEEFHAINAFNEPDVLPQVQYRVDYAVIRDMENKNIAVSRYFQVKSVAESFEQVCKDNKAKDVALTTVHDG